MQRALCVKELRVFLGVREVKVSGRDGENKIKSNKNSCAEFGKGVGKQIFIHSG